MCDLDKNAIIKQALKLSNALFALAILKQYNRLSNDRDAYLYEIIEYGLGERNTLPNKSDYGFSSPASSASESPPEKSKDQ